VQLVQLVQLVQFVQFVQERKVSQVEYLLSLDGCSELGLLPHWEIKSTRSMFHQTVQARLSKFALTPNVAHQVIYYCPHGPPIRGHCAVKLGHPYCLHLHRV